MIENARVLQPEFIPSKVERRDAEINHLIYTLEPITRGERAETAFLTGSWCWESVYRTVCGDSSP